MSQSTNSSEGLTQYVDASTIMSVPAHDPRNLWRDFLCIQKMHPQARVPTRGSAASAGLDLYAFSNGTILSGQRAVVGTQIKMSMPPGVYGRIAPRSSLAVNSGINVGAGVIDADYQGEIKIVLFNHGELPFTYNRNDRVAQLILERYLLPVIRVVTNTTDLVGTTGRGTNGLGSTGT